MLLFYFIQTKSSIIFFNSFSISLFLDKNFFKLTNS